MPFHNAPENFENAAIVLQLGLPSTLNRYENGAFPKHSANRRDLKTPAFRLRVNGKRFENRAFKNGDVTIITWFPCSRFSQTQIQNGRWLSRFQISLTYCKRRVSSIVEIVALPKGFFSRTLLDTSPRFLLGNADSSTEPIDLGESFVPDNINRPFKVRYICASHTLFVPKINYQTIVGRC